MSISVFEKVRQRIMPTSKPDQPRPDVGPAAPRVPLKVRAAKASAAMSHAAILGFGAVALHTRPDLVTTFFKPTSQLPLATVHTETKVAEARRVPLQAVPAEPVIAELPSATPAAAIVPPVARTAVAAERSAAALKTITANATPRDIERTDVLSPTDSQLKALPLTVARGVALPEARLALATAAPVATLHAAPMSRRQRDVIRASHERRVIKAREGDVAALSAAATAQPPALPATKPVAAVIAPSLTKWASLTPEQRAEANTPVKKSTPYTVANVWTDEQVAAARAECSKLLKSVTIVTTNAEPVKEGACGAPAPVNVSSVGNPKVQLHPSSMMTCPMAAALDKWITGKVQPAAAETFGSPVARLISASSYSCRNRYGSANTPLSEHALVNALDLAGFVLADGRTVRVKQDWGPVARDAAKKPVANNEIPIPDNNDAPVKVAIAVTTAPGKAGLSMLGGASLAKKVSANQDNKTASKTDGKSGAKSAASEKASAKPSGKNGKVNDSTSDSAAGKDAAASKTAADKDAAQKDAKTANEEAAKAFTVARRTFLHRVHAGACDVFGTVLGPEANDAHRDHFHLDMKARRHRAYCQ